MKGGVKAGYQHWLREVTSIQAFRKTTSLLTGCGFDKSALHLQGVFLLAHPGKLS